MTTHSTFAIDGKAYYRALAYAYAALPTDEDRAGLQHVTFFKDRIIGSDGVSRHDGHLPEEFDVPISITRVSARLLLLALEYVHKVSKMRGGTFSISHKANEKHGQEVVITYGGSSPLVHELEAVDVGGFPHDFNDWVPRDAPVNPKGFGHVNCNVERRALAWWRSWDKDYGTSEVRGGNDGGPMRRDITCDGAIVATAFVLPEDHPPGELFNDPLLKGLHGKSNLELDFSGDGAAAPKAVKIKIMVGEEEHELNVTGLGDPALLLKRGPCKHRDPEVDCLPCTEEAIAKAQVAKLAAEEPAKPKRRRGKMRQTDIEDGIDNEAPPLDDGASPDLHN